MLCHMNIKMENNGLLHQDYKRFMNYPHATIYGYILNSVKKKIEGTLNTTAGISNISINY